MEYYSERCIRLVAQVPNVITVEDYCKWYDLYVIQDDGKVVKLQDTYDQVDTIYDDHWKDHCITPKGVVELSLALHIPIGTESYIAICNMFKEQQLDSMEDDIPSGYLPEEKDLLAVLVEDNGLCEYFSEYM